MNLKQILNPKNFEGTIKERMKKVDFGYFIFLITSYKTIHMIHKRNPLYKYIDHFTPYISKKNEEDIKETNNINHINDLKLEPLDKKSLKTKEILLQFNVKSIRDLQRFQKFEINKINNEFKEKVLHIQKNVRCFLKRINIIRLLYTVMIRNCLIGVIKIQKFYKKFARRRDFKIEFFTNYILEYRNEKSNILKDLLYTYEVRLEIKNKIFINQILKQRFEKIILIQKYWLSKKYRETVLNLIKYEKDKYVLLYPYYSKKVQIKILIDRKLHLFKNYNFTICPIRKMHILYIKYSELPSKKYYCQIYADGELIGDQRFPFVQWKDNNFYSLIKFYQKGNEIIEVSESDSDEEEKKEEKIDLRIHKNEEKKFKSKEDIIKGIKKEILEEIKEEDIEDNEDGRKNEEEEEEESENEEKEDEKKIEKNNNIDEEKKDENNNKNKDKILKVDNKNDIRNDEKRENENKNEEKKVEEKKIEEKKKENKKEEEKKE